jgi:hypothetical protein
MGFKKMKRVGEILEAYTGYYTFPFSGEPFNGTVINLNPDECKIFFQMEGKGDEHKFRERLLSMDNWFTNKPYSVQQNWAKHVAKWLRQ